MRLPSFFDQLTLRKRDPRVTLQGLRANVGRKKLSLTMQMQDQTNWCWAAVSVSVVHFFDKQNRWKQCTIADAELNCTDCCGPQGSSATCNKYGKLDSALKRVGSFRSMRRGATDFQLTRAEIDADRPLGCRIAWFDAGAHFVAIIGWTETSENRYVEVANPNNDRPSQVEYDAFCTDYLDAGSWSHSYFTKPP